jgi:hypothetical protein
VVVQLIKTVHHKMGGCRVDSRWGPWIFSSDLILPSAFVALGSTQSLTEMGVKVSWCIELTMLLS